MATLSAGYPSTSEPTASTLETHPYTCNSCQVAFRSSDSQRTHMRSDWHRYNLKRRVASLPPLSSEVFTEKVLNAQASNTAAAAKATYEKTCLSCQKTYYSANAFHNHIGSQKHKQREATLRRNGVKNKDETASVISGTFSMGETINGSVADPGRDHSDEEFSDIINGMNKTELEDTTIPHRPRVANQPIKKEQEDADEQENKVEFVPTQCLFCSNNSDSLESNFSHMGKIHGTFIPELQYLADAEGLLEYLHAKINQNSECLYCHKLKSNPEAIQTHMKDKGHCMIAFETEDEMLEVGQFYDFTSTYSDDENGNPEGWETDSEADSADDSDEEVDEDSSSKPSKPRHPGQRNVDAIVYDDELYLPSGRTAGHRSLAKYFRQNLRNYPTPEERIARQQMIEDGTAEDERERLARENPRRNRALVTRANGGQGMLGATDSQKRLVRVAEIREHQRANRAQRHYQWGVDKRGNSQKHFRDPLLQ
ncbi:hypothetical protein FQN57_001387 [Myotisia sp. PD_48]|nr:hypothetical protein FQN57_001387 [Myotisia sp. PD_48]